MLTSEKEAILKQLQSTDNVEWLIDDGSNEVEDSRPEREIQVTDGPLEMPGTTQQPDILLG
jgi:hypothetical protein